MRRASRWIWAGAIGLLGLAALATFRVHQLAANGEQILARRLGEATGTTARVGRVELSLSRGSIHAHGIELALGPRTILRGGELSARVHPFGSLRPDRLELRASELHVSLDDLQRAAAGGGPELRLSVQRVTLALPQSQLLELRAVQLESAGGALTLRAEQALWHRGGALLAEAVPELRGRLEDRALSARLRLTHALLAGRPLALPLELTVTSSAAGLQVSGTLSFGSDAGALGFTWSWQRRADRMSLALRPDALQLSVALDRAGLPAALLGRADGEIMLERVGGDWTGPLKLGLQALRSPQGSFVLAQLQAAGRVRLASGQLELSELELGLPGGTLRGALRSGPERALTGTLSGEAVDLAGVERLWGLTPAGRGRVQLELAGRWDAPEIGARLALGSAALGGIALGELEGELRWRHAASELSIERVELRSPERRLSARAASLRWDEQGLRAAQARIQLTRLPLHELYRALGAADDPLLQRFSALAAGSAELQVQRDGSARRLQLGLVLSLRDASLAGYRFDGGELAADVSIADAARGLEAGRIGLPRLTLQAAGGRLQLSGSLERGALDMRLELAALPLSRLPALSSLPLAGRVDAHGQLRGASASLAVTLRDLTLWDRPLGAIQLSAQLVDAGNLPSTACAAVRAALASGTGWLICGRGLHDRLAVDLALGTGPGHPLRGRAVLEDFALAGLLPASADGAVLPGKLSAALELTAGGLAQPERMSGVLGVRALELGAGVDALHSKAPFELRVVEGQLQLSAAELEGWGQRYRLSAAGSLRAPRLRAEGSIEAGMFTRDSQPLLAAFGELATRLEWDPSRTPALQGDFELQDIALRAANVDAHKLRGTLRLRGDRLLVDELRAEVGGGQLAVSGELRLLGLRVAGYALGVRASGVTLEPQRLIDVTFDADAQLTWPGGADTPKLAGRITLQRALYAKQLHLDTLAALGAPARGGQARDRLLLDLTVAHTGPLRVRNSALEGELSLPAPLHVLGSDRQLGLIGEVAVARGRVMFQGDQYNVTQGRVAFADPQRIAPNFELRAIADRRTRPDRRIVLSARGTREAFALDVRCDAGPAKTTPAPFQCAYAGERLRCDDWDRLVTLYVCKTN
ncbi:MAG TPA: translocation/assembly module TamB domain-containing protein [Polyangiales bacterium]|nr:translocation/assembly module TamB domain-containing protein [Polyangiales bacterium]